MLNYQGVSPNIRHCSENDLTQKDVKLHLAAILRRGPGRTSKRMGSQSLVMECHGYIMIHTDTYGGFLSHEGTPKSLPSWMVYLNLFDGKSQSNMDDLKVLFQETLI